MAVSVNAGSMKISIAYKVKSLDSVQWCNGQHGVFWARSSRFESWLDYIWKHSLIGKAAVLKTAVSVMNRLIGSSPIASAKELNNSQVVESAKSSCWRAMREEVLHADDAFDAGCSFNMGL